MTNALRSRVVLVLGVEIWKKGRNCAQEAKGSVRIVGNNFKIYYFAAVIKIQTNRNAHLNVLETNVSQVECANCYAAASTCKYAASPRYKGRRIPENTGPRASSEPE